MKKLLLFASVALFGLSSAFAQRDYVGIAPPPVIVERHPPQPHRGWVWIDGHHRWDGAHYIWVHGYWTAPPRPNAVWVPGHWQRDPGGWYWIEGHWRG